MNPVLLDTSVWIPFFRAAGGEELKEAVRGALLDGRVHICWPVQAELLVGARGQKEFERLASLLGSLRDLPVGEAIWSRAARLGFRLRREGLTVPLPDLLIAQAALDGGCELWHEARHYEAVAAHAPLVTRSFLQRRTAGGT